jgi:mono/diheme cytochrome c family protein
MRGWRGLSGTDVEQVMAMANRVSITCALTMLAGFVLIGATTAAAQSVEAGKMVYTAQKCNICHSVAGGGNKKGPLDGVGKKLSADEIRNWIVDAPGMTAKTKADRKPAMKAFKLSKEDTDALVAYMQSLK